jgi:hypothetical protein
MAVLQSCLLADALVVVQASIVCWFSYMWPTVVANHSYVIVMMYTRAAASDYDDWKNIHGNTGWGASDLLPLLKKVS